MTTAQTGWAGPATPSTLSVLLRPRFAGSLETGMVFVDPHFGFDMVDRVEYDRRSGGWGEPDRLWVHSRSGCMWAYHVQAEVQVLILGESP